VIQLALAAEDPDKWVGNNRQGEETALQMRSSRLEIADRWNAASVLVCTLVTSF
jgi:hypothetical protein